MIRAAFVILIVLTGGSEFAAAEHMALQGWGTVTCAAFAYMYKEDPKLVEDHLFDWAQGMMSGLNAANIVGGQGTRDLGSMSTDQQRGALRTFCDRHPRSNYYDAVMDLFASMPSR